MEKQTKKIIAKEILVFIASCFSTLVILPIADKVLNLTDYGYPYFVYSTTFFIDELIMGNITAYKLVLIIYPIVLIIRSVYWAIKTLYKD